MFDQIFRRRKTKRTVADWGISQPNVKIRLANSSRAQKKKNILNGRFNYSRSVVAGARSINRSMGSGGISDRVYWGYGRSSKSGVLEHRNEKHSFERRGRASLFGRADPNKDGSTRIRLGSCENASDSLQFTNQWRQWRKTFTLGPVKRSGLVLGLSGSAPPSPHQETLKNNRPLFMQS